MADRFVPLLADKAARTVLGFVIAAGSPWIAAQLQGLGEPVPTSELAVMVLVFWLPATWLTDRYTHKYPQRYYSYLVASHFKGAIIIAVLAVLVWLIGAPVNPAALLVFMVIDLLASLPRRRQSAQVARPASVPANTPAPDTQYSPAPADVEIDTRRIAANLPPSVPQPMAAAICAHLPNGSSGAASLLLLSDIDDPAPASPGERAVLIGTVRLNNVNRLNKYLKHCTERVMMGGYFIVSYLPMEEALERMKQRYPGWLYPLAYLVHFIRYRALPKVPWLDRLYFLPQFAWFDRFVRRVGGGRKRVLSKSEVWGRLAYYGMEVIYESPDPGDRYVIAQRVAQPVANRKPSYYAVVALEKVGLDGSVIRLHKVRSMYPFSEFLQKKIFQSHGLSNTGKFKNDFRLTDYGPMIRRSWIDEIPGIFDWLRGDVKLVGMRATSPHFLSLYPQDVYDLYIQVKPGLVPPIFDEKTAGFDQIVEIERVYLSRYLQAPVMTDILYFWYTFRDIFIRKVRSS